MIITIINTGFHQFLQVDFVNLRKEGGLYAVSLDDVVLLRLGDVHGRALTTMVADMSFSAGRRRADSAQ